MAIWTTSRSRIHHSKDDAALAKLGYKQEFRRAFTPFEMFGLAFGYIGLIPSTTSVIFYSIPNGGPVAMVWGWVVASFFIVFIGLALSELASAAPTSGGLYYWTHSLASPRCRNFLAWVVGYANTIQNVAGMASVDWACAVQITAAVSIASGQPYSPSNQKLYGIFAALVISHAILVSMGTRVLARLQRLYIAMNVGLCLMVIIALPIATPAPYRNTASYALGTFTNLNGWPSGLAFIFSLMTPLWTIGGYDCSVHMSEEASNAAIAIPSAIMSSIVATCILGWGVVVTLVFFMGTDLNALLNSTTGQPMAQILYNSLGQRGALVAWCLVIAGQYMVGSNGLLVASRQTFAFARDGALPFSRYLYRINRYTLTPVNTVWFDAACILAIGALAFASIEAVDAVFTIGITASYVSFATPIATRFAFKNNFRPGPFNLGRLGFPVAVVAVVWMFFMSIMFCFPMTPHTNAQQMNYTVVVFGGWMSLAIAWYYFPVYGGVHWFNGPVHNIKPKLDDEPRDAEMDEYGQKDEESISEKADGLMQNSVLAVDA